LAGSNQTIQRFRVVQGGRPASPDRCVTSGWKKEPLIAEEPETIPNPLLETRRKNRLMLAEEYARWHPSSRIESLSHQADELKRDLESRNDDNQKSLRYCASCYARRLRGSDARDREHAAQKLAFFSSDPWIYGNDTSATALSGLVAAASHGVKEAGDALRSLGLDAGDILKETSPLAFKVGMLARHVMRILSRKIDVALRAIELKMDIEL